jgi:hypothetical protein
MWPVPTCRSLGPLFDGPCIQAVFFCKHNHPSRLFLSPLRCEPRRLHGAALPLSSALPTPAGVARATANSRQRTARCQSMPALHRTDALLSWRTPIRCPSRGRAPLWGITDGTHQQLQMLHDSSSHVVLSFPPVYLSVCVLLIGGTRFSLQHHIAILVDLSSLLLLGHHPASSRSTLASETPILARLQVRLEFPDVFSCIPRLAAKAVWLAASYHTPITRAARVSPNAYMWFSSSPPLIV